MCIDLNRAVEVWHEARTLQDFLQHSLGILPRIKTMVLPHVGILTVGCIKLFAPLLITFGFEWQTSH